MIIIIIYNYNIICNKLIIIEIILHPFLQKNSS